MAKKVILKDLKGTEVLPITRGELVIDSSGKQALHSNEFLATTSLPGLMSATDKNKLDNFQGDTYELSGVVSADQYITTLTSSKGVTTNAVIEPMQGATVDLAGKVGLVPAPLAGYQNKFLSGDGTWKSPEGTSVTAEDILEKLKTVDGSGSGLDADTLDGTEKSELFTSLTTSTTSISMTIGGVNKTVISPALIYNKYISEVASSSTTPTAKFPGTKFGTKTGLYLTGGYNYDISILPKKYGNIINIIGDGGGQLFAEWTSNYTTGHLYYRSHRDYLQNGGWTPWKTVAFIDDNVASATKLQTARTIWGQSFDGSADVTGNLTVGDGDIYIRNARFIRGHNSNGVSIPLMYFSSANNFVIGNYVASGGYNTVISGNNLTFKYGVGNNDGIILNSSGNVLIGTTTDSGYKLDVVGGNIRTSRNFIVTNVNGEWAKGLSMYIDGYEGGFIGYRGNNSSLSYISLGPSYSSSWMALNSGNVGIGTESPAYKLDVNGTIHTNASLHVDSYSNFKGVLFLNSGDQGISLMRNGISWHNAGNVVTSNLLEFSSDGIVSVTNKLKISDIPLYKSQDGVLYIEGNLETQGNVKANSFIGNLDGTYINALTGYTKATSASDLVNTDTLNIALGKLEYKAGIAYSWYRAIIEDDTDDIINKWEEIVDFIDSVKEGTDITDEFVTRKTALTITGYKTFNSDFATNSKIVFTSIDSSDQIWIQAETLASGLSNLIFYCADNANDGFVFRSRLYATGTSYDVLKITLGGITATSNITAPKFVTSGGTSSLFVKGDGSLDSNTYLTSSGSLKNPYSIKFKKTDDTTVSYDGSSELDLTEGIRYATKSSVLSTLEGSGTVTGLPYYDYNTLNSEFGTTGAATTTFLKNYIKKLVKSHSGIRNYVGIGAVTPNSIRIALYRAYSLTNYNNTGMPQYSSGFSIPLDARPEIWGTNLGNWYHRLLAYTTDIPTKVSLLENDLGFVTGGPYLPLSGGQMTGNIVFLGNNYLYGDVAHTKLSDVNGFLSVYHIDKATILGAYGDGTTPDIATYIRSTGNNLYHRQGNYNAYKDYRIWDEGNDGADSGLDADLLDGKHASHFATAADYVTLGTSQTITGLKTFNTSSNSVPVIISRTGSTECVKIGVNDSQTIFDYTNDETSCSYIFKMTNTDTESGNGNSNTSSVVFSGNSSGATVTANKFVGILNGTADKVANSLILKIKSGSAENTDLYTYNGSAAKTLDIKLGSNITLTAATNSLTIAASDTKVTQTNTTTNANYRVLLSGNANDTTETTTARKSGNLLFNPKTGLSVYGSTHPNVFLMSDDSECSLYFISTFSGLGWAIGTGTWGVNGFGIGEYKNKNTCYLTILQNGNVGIAALNPACKLDVNGDTRVTGVFRVYPGDATLAIYADTSANSNYGTEGISIQTTFDGEDPVTSSYPSLYPTRGVLQLQPKGGNIAIGRTTASYKVCIEGSLYASSWLRTAGDTGWYNETYGGGIYMTDNTWIRTYNGKSFYCDHTIYAGGVLLTSSQTFLRYVLYPNKDVLGFGWDGSYGDYLWFKIPGTNNQSTHMRLCLAGGLYIWGNGVAYHFYEHSDIRYKNVLEDINISVSELATLPLFNFEWTDRDSGVHSGSSAQSVQKLLPNLVSADGEKLTLDYGVLGTIAGITACRELTKHEQEIQNLQNKIKDLEKEIENLKNKN